MLGQNSQPSSFASHFSNTFWPQQELTKNKSFYTLAYLPTSYSTQQASFSNSFSNSNFQPIFQLNQQLPLIPVPSNQIQVKIEKNSRTPSPIKDHPKHLKVTTKIKHLKKQIQQQSQQSHPSQLQQKNLKYQSSEKKTQEESQQSKKSPEDVRECVTVKNCHRNITNKIFRLFKVESFKAILMKLCAQQDIQLTEFLEYFDEEMRKNFTNIEFLTQQWSVIPGDNSNENKLKWIFREFYRHFLDKCAINYLLLGPTRDKHAYLNTIIQMLRYIDKPHLLTTFMMSKHQKIMKKMKDNNLKTEYQEPQQQEILF